MTWGRFVTRPFAGTHRYQVVRPLGAGSFGAVYEVVDRERGSHVALKVLTRVDASTLYRFKAEFRGFADVHHPNLVQLYELVSDGDDWFFTMELLSAVDWLSFVRQRPRRVDPEHETLSAPGDLAALRTAEAGPQCDIDRVYASALQLASAVHALHKAGIVHRDVKPSNVLVEPSGRVVLVDFGLARPLASDPRTHTGLDAVGTPAYMAPEQATSAEITEAADWYAVGVMLFEALTGRLPFEGKALEIIAHKQARDAPRVADLIASARPELEALASALLSRDPAGRPRGDLVLEILGAYRPAEAARGEAKPAPAERSPFVGRKQPMHDLEAAFRRAQRGATVTALVRGPSGIGKSALVRALFDEIVQPLGGLVLAGRCYEREAVSYKAFDSAIDALSRFLVQLPADQAAAALPRDVAALARVFPVLDRVPTIAQAPRRVLDAIDGQRLRTRAFAALRELLARLGDRHPLVLLLDDFQWADDESLALLRDLTRGDPAPAMLVVITFRDEDVGRSGPLDALLATVRESEVTSGRGGGNRQDQAGAALDGGVARARRRGAGTRPGRSGGCRDRERVGWEPVLSGRARAVRPHGPRRQRGRSPFGWRRSSRSASRASTPRSGAFSRSSPSPARRSIAASPARPRRSPPPTPSRSSACSTGRSSFAPPGASARTSWSASTTGSARRWPGRSPTRSGASTISGSSAALQTLREADPEALFLHYEAAGISERAAEYALVSAQRAVDALAFEHAARLYESALELLPKDAPDRNAILVRMAEALMRSGRGVESADAFLRAIDGAAPRDVLTYRHRAAEQLLFCGQLERGLRIMSQICDQVGVTIPRSRAHAIAQLVFLMLWVTVKGRRFRARDPATVTPAELTRADVCWSMAGGLSLVDQVIARPFSLRAVLTSLAAGDSARVVRALVTEAGFCSSEGRAPSGRWPRSSRWRRASSATRPGTPPSAPS